MRSGVTYYFIFLLLLPALVIGQNLPKPYLSHSAGYYADSIVLSMSSPVNGAQIRYTLNGNEPTSTSLIYSGPIVIKNRSHQKNGISTIPTNPSLSYPHPGYDTSRANSRGWLPPYDTIFKATVVKAKTYKNGLGSDSTTVATYLIKEGSTSIFNLPVISLSLDSAGLFDADYGIYVYGNDSLNEGNYMKDTAERKSYIEFFDINGIRIFGQYGNIKIHGSGGRHAPQKSLQLKASAELGNETFDYQFFQNSPVSKFDRLLLRNSGHRPDCMPRDDIAQEFLKSLENISQHNLQSVVLINGEYWGVQTIKEVLDNNYFYRRYNMPKSECVILTQAGSLDEGNPSDETSYAELLNFFSQNDFTLPQSYNYVKTQMVVESFVDFECAEIFLGNGDWPNNNTKFWRFRRDSNDPNTNNHLDGRWRWLFYDLDATFGGDCKGIYPSHNALVKATDPSYNNYTKPLRTLLNNTDFKIYFINRFADLINSNFLPTQLINAINKTTSAFNSEMQNHVERWRYPSVATDLQSRSVEVPSTSKWNGITSDLLNFAAQRPVKTLRHFMNYFLLDTVKVTLDVNDTLMGKVKINSLYIDSYLIRNKVQVYPWTGTYFNGNPVTIEAIAYPGFKFSYWNSMTDTMDVLIKNITSDSSLTAHFIVDTTFRAKQYIYINEVLASNKNNIRDEYFENDDWIELYNPNNFSVDISGFYLSDDVNNKTKYRIKNSSDLTIIKPKGFLLVWLDNDNAQGNLHCNFKLNAGSDSLYLTLPNGVETVDSVIFQDQTQDVSYGRLHDGDSTWISFATPTPNATNRLFEVPEADNFIIYPNPTSDILNFTQTKTITVYDLLGRQLISLTNVKKVDVSNLTIGMYILKTNSGNTLKFIKR